MTKTAAKRKAQDLILDQLAKIGYGDEYEDFIQEVSPDNPDEAAEILKSQMDRVAKMFGYGEAWFG